MKLRYGAGLCAPLLVMLLGGGVAGAAAAPSLSSRAVPVPTELRATRFSVSVNGRPAYFLNAAANYYDLNLILRGKTEISITAPTSDYWQKGVEIQPWRENIRPLRNGATITFSLDHAAKLAISRPGDHLGGAEMLFVFANMPQRHLPTAASKGLRFFGPGVHHGGIDARSGDRIYLAPGAVVLGGLNLWDVEDVKVFGLGTILYDGPQNPNDDEGWMNKKDWHAIVMHNARNIRIEDVTCIVRSRTWMIQMRDSRFVTFDNVKVIGGSASNANQDGMDWLGGGDTVVRNSFIRAADDIFALQGNWDGYDPELMKVPGHDVTNITIENSVLSTSISNVVRVGWPTKTFNSSHFTLRNSDVIHMGIGGCGIPFALLELWGVPDAYGHHSDYLFNDIRLEDWYSLVQLEQKNPGVDKIRFNNIWAIEQHASAPSQLLGDVNAVSFNHVKFGDRTARSADDLNLQTSDGAALPEVEDSPAPLHAAFTYSNVVGSSNTFMFDASASTLAEGLSGSYDWFFGDGAVAHGAVVEHTFADESGTLLDGSGRYRVMLRATGGGAEDWIAQPVVVKAVRLAAQDSPSMEPGLHYVAYGGDFPGLTGLDEATLVAEGIATKLDTSKRPSDDHYALVFDGLLDVPQDGGYSFTELSRDGSRLWIDDTVVLEGAAAWPQVCGSIGNAVQQAVGTIGLIKGRHKIKVAVSKSLGEEAFALLWQGPGISLQSVPESSLSH